MATLPRLVIVGAGGFGREVLGWALDVERSSSSWVVAGFLDDDPRALDSLDVSRPLLGSVKDHQPHEGNERFLCAIGQPRVRLRVCAELARRGARFATLTHPSATVAAGTDVGEGCILCPGAVVTANASIGKFGILNVHSSVGHDSRLGPGCTLSAHADITGGVRLGTGVFLGSHAVVLPGAEVGDFAVVGAGSVVIRRVPAGATVFGVPARRIGGFEPEGLDR